MYEDKILVLVDGLEIDVSANDAEWLVNADNEDYLMVDDRIYQRRPASPINPFEHAPKHCQTHPDWYNWWHRR